MSDHLIVLHSAGRACASVSRHDGSLDPDVRLVDRSATRSTVATVSRAARRCRQRDARGRARGRRFALGVSGAVQGHPPPGPRGVRGLLLQPAQPGVGDGLRQHAKRAWKRLQLMPDAMYACSRTSSNSSWTATIEELRAVLAIGSRSRTCGVASRTTARRRWCCRRARSPSRGAHEVRRPERVGLGLLPRPVDRYRPGAPAHRGRARGVGRAFRGALNDVLP